MGIENPIHLLFIAIIALIVLGPKRLPELARALGHGIREFREAVSQQGEPHSEPTIPQGHAVALPDPEAPPSAQAAFGTAASEQHHPPPVDPSAPGERSTG
ncbi:MAG TPA: twin-arginine translocase TatA/TatE family subunit [Solirubrobacteraceae bacterium]